MTSKNYYLKSEFNMIFGCFTNEFVKWFIYVYIHIDICTLEWKTFLCYRLLWFYKGCVAGYHCKKYYLMLHRNKIWQNMRHVTTVLGDMCKHSVYTILIPN